MLRNLVLTGSVCRFICWEILMLKIINELLHFSVKISCDKLLYTLQNIPFTRWQPALWKLSNLFFFAERYNYKYFILYLAIKTSRDPLYRYSAFELCFHNASALYGKGNRTMPEENPRPSADCCVTFSRAAGGEDNMTWQYRIKAERVTLSLVWALTDITCGFWSLP